jgi:hypothetical protein
MHNGGIGLGAYIPGPQSQSALSQNMLAKVVSLGYLNNPSTSQVAYVMSSKHTNNVNSSHSKNKKYNTEWPKNEDENDIGNGSPSHSSTS